MIGGRMLEVTAIKDYNSITAAIIHSPHNTIGVMLELHPDNSQVKPAARGVIVIIYALVRGIAVMNVCCCIP
jgi:hypothetical protein